MVASRHLYVTKRSRKTDNPAHEAFARRQRGDSIGEIATALGYSCEEIRRMLGMAGG